MPATVPIGQAVECSSLLCFTLEACQRRKARIELFCLWRRENRLTTHPRTRSVRQAVCKTTQQLGAARGQPHLMKLASKILIADADPVVLQKTVHGLQSEGFEVLAPLD